MTIGKYAALSLALLFSAAGRADTYRDLPVLNWEPRSDWINVRDFGAKGDGRTDDTSALRKAFSGLENGVTIYLPPGEYLKELRFSHAMDLLRRTDLPLTDISIRCGFCDGNYLCRLFRRRMGITPRQFRTLGSR